MDSTNQIQTLVDEVEKNPEYKISEQEAKGFLSEVKRLTKEDKTNKTPLVVIIMAYINMFFPELDEVKI
jgi:polyhydroxyalkanoate synthesis regulator phasin